MEIVVPDEFRYLYNDPNSRILTVPAPVLRQKSAEVTKLGKPILHLIDDLMRSLRKANGVGLAAPQMGVLKRVVVVAPLETRPEVLINPKIIKAEGEQVGLEGCLSIPGLYGDVKRAAYIEVEAFDRKGREMVFELEGMPARIAQHEIDHLDGILFTDKVIVETLHWSHPDREPPAE